MPTASRGTPATPASILSDFITTVKNPYMAVLSVWHLGNPPVVGMAPGLLGAQAQADPTWTIPSTSVHTTNVFYLLHGYAIALTRHRQATVWYNTNGVPALIGSNLTSYKPNFVVWFDPPAIPDPGTAITSSDITTFLNALATSVMSIKTDAAHAVEFVGCHTSCHSACHGSRGRR